MKRKLYDDLLKWKDAKGRKPLLLTGARQVGKTYLLKKFGDAEFKNVIYLNLDKERERYAPVFKDSISPTDIIARLEAIVGTKIEPKDTLIIFDEVQEIPRALTSLKYFCEDGSLLQTLSVPEFFVKHYKQIYSECELKIQKIQSKLEQRYFALKSYQE